MRLLRELEKNKLTLQEWNKFYIEFIKKKNIINCVHRKIAIFFDHSRLGLENKFFPNKTQSFTYTTFIL